MPILKPFRLCLLLAASLLTACAAANLDRSPDSFCRQQRNTAPPIIETPLSWTTYPILAHKLNGEEAPIVRWIDTDGDGVSNYRLLCTFENGRVRVKKAIRDRSFVQKFKGVRG